MLDLGGAQRHECVLVEGFLVKPEERQIIADMAREIYGNVETIGTWYEDSRPWPINANLMWQRTAQYMFEKRKCPWFWQEADCLPVKPGWLDAWEAEFLACGKPYMGCVVKDPFHLTGNAVYPPDVRKFCPEQMIADVIPWDVTGMPKILPHTHHTDLYHHQWFYNVEQPANGQYSRNATHFDNVDQLSIINPKAVLFHRNKDGSLIQCLRERMRA